MRILYDKTPLGGYNKESVFLTQLLKNISIRHKDNIFALLDYINRKSTTLKLAPKAKSFRLRSILEQKKNIIGLFSKDIDKENQQRILKDIDKHDIYHVINPVNYEYSPTKAKKIVTIHDTSYLKKAFATSKKATFFKAAIPKIVNDTERIQVFSEFSKKILSTSYNIDKNKIFVTPTGTSKVFRPTSVKDRSFLTKYNVSSDIDYFLFVGKLSEKNNIITMLEAYAELPDFTKEGNNLIIIGSPTNTEYLETIKKVIIDCKLKNYVKIFSNVSNSELLKLYNHANIFIKIPQYVDYSLSISEALSCGLPCIISNLDSLSEQYEDACHYVNCNKRQEIKQSMINLINNKDMVDTLKRKALMKSTEFSWENTVDETFKAYVNLLIE